MLQKVKKINKLIKYLKKMSFVNKILTNLWYNRIKEQK